MDIYEEEMGSDIVELEMLAGQISAPVRMESSRSLHNPVMEEKPEKEPAAPLTAAEKKLEDLIQKVKPYYGEREDVLKALCDSSLDREVYLLSLSYVTLGGKLTELDPEMLPKLKAASDAAGPRLGVTKDLDQWKLAYKEIKRRISDGIEIKGLGRKLVPVV